MVGEGSLPVPGGEAPGGIRSPGFSHRQIHEGVIGWYQIQPGFAAFTACPCRLSTGYSSGIIDS